MLAVCAPVTLLASPTMDYIKANKVLRCGVHENLLGFSRKDEAGKWQGFNVDFCRAVAAAVLGDADKVAFVPVTAASRFPMLLSGKIELLMRNTTQTFEREAAIGVHFAGIYYLDGQAFMVPKKSGIRTLAELNGATICYLRRTTHKANMADYFTLHGWDMTPLSVETGTEMISLLEAGQCQAVTSDRSQLAALRLMEPNGMEKFHILPEIISQEPLGAVVRRGDENWLTAVKWVLYALIEAEERGITQAEARKLLENSPDPGTRRFLASDGLPEKALGLQPGWVLRVIEAVGNYGEMYERHLGESGLKLDRGLNRLTKKGGLMYSPPFR